MIHLNDAPQPSSQSHIADWSTLEHETIMTLIDQYGDPGLPPNYIDMSLDQITIWRLSRFEDMMGVNAN